MAAASEAMDFETAARLRDQIVAIRTRVGGQLGGRRHGAPQGRRPQGQRPRHPPPLPPTQE